MVRSHLAHRGLARREYHREPERANRNPELLHNAPTIPSAERHYVGTSYRSIKLDAL
jgi:hypothetical protein